jgi:phosphotransferase system  glucose/maltose/N-acetylglucosamine-specific IIC component
MRSQPERNEEMDVRKGPLDDLSSKILTSANSAMLLTIVFHDADHCRQAMNWGYTIPLAVWLVNCIVYLPNGVALLLTRQRRRSAALATCLAGLLIAVAFAKVHLLGADIPVWGIWNRSFFVLGVDTISWSILACTVAVGIGVGIAGVYVMGRLSPGAVLPK